MKKERILITVKTYPTLSKKYGETVCTAGLREDGSWVRIYPVPFRRLDEEEQYKKYDWIECRLVRHSSDPRPETYRPIDEKELHPVARIDTSDQWRERRRIVLGKAHVYHSLDLLIKEAKANQRSLAVFKPARIIDFVFEEDTADWNESKLAEMRKFTHQLDLFSDNSWRDTFKIIPKLPFSFSYRFEDIDGKSSEMQILDWEIGALYWNCYWKAGQNKNIALDKVKEKYFGQFLKTDLHFYLGTTFNFHFVAPNPWVIIGVFPAPKETQGRLF